MHEHDLDLVAALADGTLDGDTEAVQRLVATCDRCREEYRTQVAVRSLLADLPAVALTDSERSALRDGVDAALPDREAVPTRVPEPRRSSPWWWRLVPAAGAAVLVLAVAGVLVGGSGDESLQTLANVGESSEAVGGERSAATTAAAAEQTTTTGDAGGDEGAIGAFSEEAPDDLEDGEAATDATIPATTAPAQDTEEDEAPGETVPASRFLAGTLPSLDDLASLLTDPARGDGDFTPEVEFVCIDAASQPPIDGIAGVIDGTTIELFRLPDDGGRSVLEAYAAPECSPVDLPD